MICVATTLRSSKVAQETEDGGDVGEDVVVDGMEADKGVEDIEVEHRVSSAVAARGSGGDSLPLHHRALARRALLSDSKAGGGARHLGGARRRRAEISRRARREAVVRCGPSSRPSFGGAPGSSGAAAPAASQCRTPA